MKNKFKLIQKAWGINWDKISEGAYYRGCINPVYAPTKGKAKSLLLNDISDYRLYKTDEYVTYVTMPIVRYPGCDKFDVYGELLTMHEYNEKNMEQERNAKFDDIINNDAITHCIIMKRGEYYRDNYKGYTENYFDAGFYPKMDAVGHAKSCGDIILIPINNSEHNTKIKNYIEYLKSKLLHV